MDPVLLSTLLSVIGTQGIPLILKLKQDIDAGRRATTVTNEDLLELQRLASQSAADILKKVGVTLP